MQYFGIFIGLLTKICKLSIVNSMENITLEDSIIAAMEGTDKNLVKYLPYILQDVWELGTSSEEIIEIIKKQKQDYSNLSILDLGSGKGAISIKIALELKCKCFGIDGIEDFVVFSKNKAKEYSVDDICIFEKNDIRTRIKTLGKFDIILLGAIGPVLGNYYNTLLQLGPHLNSDGIIIIVDAYVESGCQTDYPGVLPINDILEQINNAGMQIIDRITDSETYDKKVEYGYDNEYKDLEKRCIELINKYPEDKELFLEYMKIQKELYWKLSNEVTPVIFVIKKK
jgi:SAM-dependent methyltransferase